MKILVTGGAGYIGAHTVYELINKNYEVVVVDNLSTGMLSNVHPKASFYQIDIRDEKKLEQVFEKEKNIEAVMDFAGSIVVSESVKKPLEYFNNNVYSVEILLRVMNKFNVKNIVFSSTAAVYGEPKEIPIYENSQKNPINPYGCSKLAAESLIISWKQAIEGANYVIFRYFNVAGANKNKKIGIKTPTLTHLVPVIVDCVLNNKPFNAFGNDYTTKDGFCIRDFIHVVDLAIAHIMGLEWSFENKCSDVFNLGSSCGYSVLEVYNEAKKTLNYDIKLNICPKREGDPAVLLASIEKVKQKINWFPNSSLSEIIHDEYNFRKELIQNKNK